MSTPLAHGSAGEYPTAEDPAKEGGSDPLMKVVGESQQKGDVYSATGVEIPNWTKNLARKGGGFWPDARWYDLQLARRVPLADTLVQEVVYALPPLPKGARICDLAGGSGRASRAVLSAYPGVKIVLLDASSERVAMAQSAMPQIEAVEAKLELSEVLPRGPYDAIIAILAIHVLVGHCETVPRAEGEQGEQGDAKTRYAQLFHTLFQSLNPGGLLMVGDHGDLSLYEQMKMMDSVGFVDIDCAWRQNDMFVFAGRRPSLSSANSV